MDTRKYPWEYHPELKDERLRYIASILVETRHATLALYDPRSGDGEWSLGCRIYQRTCNQIIRAADRATWLGIVDASLQFIFSIGVVPIRFYHGDGDDPSPRNLACCFNELRQMTLTLQDDTPLLIWRFAVETDSLGEVTNVIFFGSTAEDDNPVCYYPVPFGDRKVSYLDGKRRRGGGVDLPPPSVDDIPPDERHGRADKDGKESE